MFRNNNINTRKFAFLSGLLLFRLNKNDFVNRENTYGFVLTFLKKKLKNIRN